MSPAKRVAGPAIPAPARGLGDEDNPLERYYLVLIDLLKDQVSAQLDQASTIELKSAGLTGVVIATILSALILRAGSQARIDGLWWWPLPLLVAAGLYVGTGALAGRAEPGKGAVGGLRRRVRALFDAQESLADGPKVQTVLERASESERGVELVEQLQQLVEDLVWSFNHNVEVLRHGATTFRRAYLAVGAATLITLGWYAYVLR